MDSLYIYILILLMITSFSASSYYYGRNSLGMNLGQKIIFSLVISAPVIILLSLRYNVGTDFFNYERFYLYYESTSKSHFEPGFNFLMSFCKTFFGPYQSFITITAIVSVLPPIGALVGTSKRYLWLQNLAMYCLFLGIWCAAIRQSIALGFIFVALSLLTHGKKFGFIFFIFFASLFHYSALILSPFFFLITKKESSIEIQKWKIVFSSAIIAVLLLFFFFEGRNLGISYSSYIGSTKEGGITYMYLLLSIFLYIPEFFLCEKICLANKYNFILYVMIVFELALYFLSSFIPHVFRMGYYFSLAHILLIPHALSVCKNRDGQFILTLYYILFFLFYFYVTAFVLRFNGISEYQTFLN